MVSAKSPDEGSIVDTTDCRVVVTMEDSRTLVGVIKIISSLVVAILLVELTKRVVSPGALVVTMVTSPVVIATVVAVGSTGKKSVEISSSVDEEENEKMEVGSSVVVVDAVAEVMEEVVDRCGSIDEKMSSPDPKSAGGVSEGSSSASLSSNFFTRYAILLVGSKGTLIVAVLA